MVKRALHRSTQEETGGCPPSGLVSLNTVPTPVVLCDKDFSITYANNAFCSAFSAEGVVEKGVPLISFLRSANPREHPLSLLPDGCPYEFYLEHVDGVPRWSLITISPYDDTDAWIVQVTDIDNQVSRRQQIAYRESIWRNAVSAACYGVWDHQVLSDQRFYSNEWRLIRGIPAGEKVCGSYEDWEKRIHPDDVDAVNEYVQRHHNNDVSEFAFEYREQHRDGHWIWIFTRGKAVERDGNGLPLRVVGIDVDVTDLKNNEDARAHEVQLKYKTHLQELEQAHAEAETARAHAHEAARVDPLTGLANRRVFSEALAELTEPSDTTTLQFAVCLIDLDRFKYVNDTFGHMVGDTVICEISERMLLAVGPDDLVARLGGDEFGVILLCRKGEDIKARANLISARIVELVKQPIRMHEKVLDVGASIGISLSTNTGNTENILMRNADIAMYSVKRNRRGGYALFDPEMERRRTSRDKLETDVREAVMNEAIIPFFQPVLDMKTGKVTSFEILARWSHPDQGNIPPKVFVPIIERMGLNREFGLSMLGRAIEVARDWPEDCRISLNVSSRSIANVGFAKRLDTALGSFECAPDRLQVELPDSIVRIDPKLVNDEMSILRETGIHIVLDDFGGGNSGLYALRDLQLDCLKLDQTFILSIDDCDKSRRIVDMVLSLAKQFGISTVAKGVANEAILNRIKHLGFDYGQGFLFSKAIPGEETHAFLQRYSDNSEVAI